MWWDSSSSFARIAGLYTQAESLEQLGATSCLAPLGATDTPGVRERGDLGPVHTQAQLHHLHSVALGPARGMNPRSSLTASSSKQLSLFPTSLSLHAFSSAVCLPMTLSSPLLSTNPKGSGSNSQFLEMSPFIPKSTHP